MAGRGIGGGRAGSRENARNIGGGNAGNTGLALLAVSSVAAAIVAGLAFGTLTALSAGLTVVTAVELAGAVALGLAAWTQVQELYKVTPRRPWGSGRG